MLAQVRFFAALMYEPLPTTAIAGAVTPANPVKASAAPSTPDMTLFFMFIMLFPFFCERGRDGEVRPAGVKATTCTAGKAGFDLPLTEPDRFLTRLDANAMVCALFREGSWTDEGSDCRRQRQSR